MSTPHNPASEDRTGPVASMLHSVDELGSNTGRLFGRLYGGLRRKNREREAVLHQTRLQAAQLQAQAREQATDIARLTGVLARISEGVIMQDTEGRIVLMNQAARDLLGSVRMFWDSELGQMFAAARNQTALDGEITLGEAQRVDVNNRVIGAQLAIVADESGTRLGTVLMLRDVTRDALADRLKDEFITQMSHELRTPLAAIKGMSEVLLAAPEDRPPNRKFLEAISRNVALLDRMIIELLDISEIGAGSFAVREQDIQLENLIWTVLQGFEVRVRKANLSVGVMIGSRARLNIIGDDRRLQWALGHLLDNSIKYTEPGGEITIQAGHVRRGYIQIEVHDTGAGITERDLPHVFERFYRGEARTASGKLIDPRGLGQGLFVARAVAEAHGGFLSVASQEGQGSTFSLALPLDGTRNQKSLPEMPAAPLIDEPPIDPTAATVPSQSTPPPELHTDTPEEQWD
ncbi:MAG: PAS domain-containing sensor histidine kinase [Chloroflexi bacterium]|nr:PAS domain-containing sensor histidine kinase [Chloroflexota bacterium]